MATKHETVLRSGRHSTCEFCLTTRPLWQESYSTLLIIICFSCFRLFSLIKESTRVTKIDLDIRENPNWVRKMADNKSKHNSKSNLWKYFCALEKFSIPWGLDSRRGEVVKNRHLVELFYWRANVRLKVFFCLLEGKRNEKISLLLSGSTKRRCPIYWG